MNQLYALLTACQVARGNDAAFVARERAAIDKDTAHASVDPIPYLCEDMIYHDTAFATRESALHFAPLIAAHWEVSELVLVELKFEQPESFVVGDNASKDGRINLDASEARHVNVHSTATMTTIAVDEDADVEALQEEWYEWERVATLNGGAVS